MTEWIDVLVYAALMLILWFALPAANARFTLPVIEDRNRDWPAAHPELAQRVARSRWFRATSSLLGALSIAALVAVQLGAWPAAWSAPAFEPERWMVLADVFTALTMLWLVFFATGAAIFQRWLTREVPLAERREATLERRSVSTYAPHTLRAVVFIAVGLHLTAWIIVGMTGRASSATFWWNVAFQFVIAASFVVIARAIAERRPHAMDRIFGPAFRRREVRFALWAQLLPLLNGGARLYEEVAGVTVPDFDRLARLGLVVFMIAGVSFGFFRFTWSWRGGADSSAARASSKGALALLLIALAITSWSTSALAQEPSGRLPADAEIRRIIADRVDNTDSATGPDDIGMHLLNQQFPLQQTFPPPLAPRTETRLDPLLFDRYVGRYQFAPAVHLTVTRNENRFFGELTGQPLFEMFAESETRFFPKAVDAQLTFETDAANGVTAVVLHQGGRDQRAPRVVGEVVMPKAVSLAPAVLDRYIGRYQIAPGVILTVTRKDARLFVQVPGGPPLEAFATSEREFFHKDVDVQLTFESDDQSAATAVIVHQDSKNQRVPRTN